MVESLEHLKSLSLTDNELDAAQECGRQVMALEFRLQDDCKVCDDSKGLENALGEYIKVFAPWFKFDGETSKLQAFQFEKSTTPTTSEPMLLIPVTITGSSTTSGEVSNVESYVQIIVTPWRQDFQPKVDEGYASEVEDSYDVNFETMMAQVKAWRREKEERGRARTVNRWVYKPIRQRVRRDVERKTFPCDVDNLDVKSGGRKFEKL